MLQLIELLIAKLSKSLLLYIAKINIFIEKFEKIHNFLKICKGVISNE